MAKMTTRDRIWDEALRLAVEKQRTDTFSKFDENDVLDRLEDKPSKRTIRDCLDSMAELGHLERRWRGFEAAEIEDTVETTA